MAIIKCIYHSESNSGYLSSSPAKLNTATGEVFDIEDCDDDSEDNDGSTVETSIDFYWKGDWINTAVRDEGEDTPYYTIRDGKVFKELFAEHLEDVMGSSLAKGAVKKKI